MEVEIRFNFKLKRWTTMPLNYAAIKTVNLL